MISIKDIAAKTGYSITTVGAVLRGQSERFGIKPVTSRKILDAAEELGYCKNNLASRIKTGRSNTLIFFTQADESVFIAGSILQAEALASREGYFLKIMFMSSDPVVFEASLQQAVGERPAAFLSAGDFGVRFQLLKKCSVNFRIPWVVIDLIVDFADVCIFSDDKPGIEGAVRYLAENGYKRLAHITDAMMAQFVRTHYEAYKLNCVKFNLEMPEKFCYFSNFPHIPSQPHEFVESLLTAPDRPDAIVCGSDFFAMNVMLDLFRSGLNLPEDIGLVGFGGLDSFASIRPPVATINQSWNVIAEFAVAAAIVLAKGGKPEKIVCVPTKFKPGFTLRGWAE